MRILSTLLLALLTLATPAAAQTLHDRLTGDLALVTWGADGWPGRSIDHGGGAANG